MSNEGMSDHACMHVCMHASGHIISNVVFMVKDRVTFSINNKSEISNKGLFFRSAGIPALN